MSDVPLLTLRQIAFELGLPESTVRYHRDVFLQHVPAVGVGRRRRYPRAAVAVLRFVADSYAAGRSRAAILAAMAGTDLPHPPDAQGPDGRGPGAGVSNLELLAAIVNGQREQREALWQMAQEIVRLTGVLEGHERVLAAIADRAGLPALGPAAEPPKALAPGGGGGRGTPIAAGPPAGPTMSAAELERLKAELEAERQLVERLREAKVQLEHRVSDAEAALEDRGPSRRDSLLDRLLGR